MFSKAKICEFQNPGRSITAKNPIYLCESMRCGLTFNLKLTEKCRHHLIRIEQKLPVQKIFRFYITMRNVQGMQMLNCGTNFIHYLRCFPLCESWLRPLLYSGKKFTTWIYIMKYSCSLKEGKLLHHGKRLKPMTVLCRYSKRLKRVKELRKHK